MWLYYWGMTERQVDLLLTDQPLVVYNHDKKSSSKKGKGAPEFSTATEGDVMQAAAKFAAKHGVGGSGKVELDLKNVFK